MSDIDILIENIRHASAVEGLTLEPDVEQLIRDLRSGRITEDEAIAYIDEKYSGQ